MSTNSNVLPKGQPKATARTVAEPAAPPTPKADSRNGAGGRLECEAIARAALGEPLRQVGAELLWRCPNHDDEHPSLSVNPQKNVWFDGPCGASGNAWQLTAFLARVGADDKSAVKQWLADHGLFSKAPSGNGKRGRDPVATHPYFDAEGKPLARKLRYKPKSFSWERWENGKWLTGLGGIKPPLYRLPEIQRSQSAIFVEGEKDADNGARIGLPTTTSGGTGSWRPEHADCLRGKDVVIIPDADPPGRTHAQRVAASLYGKVPSLKVLELPGAKDLTDWLERGGTAEVLRTLIEPAPEWKPCALEIGALLDKIVVHIRRYMVMTEAQARAVSLWVVHTHSLQAADTTPYLSITSPEKASGKSQLLELLEMLTFEPWLTGRVTAAVLPRRIEAKQPTLLLDESDTAFASNQEYAETLRGVLNSGYRRSGIYSCCTGQGANLTYKDFPTFCVKAIAGIGKLPDTVADRSIPIRLRRAAKGERGGRFRKRIVKPLAEPLRQELEQWAAIYTPRLFEANPTLPEELSDRQQDVCEPLLAIADVAGGEWPEQARLALIELCAQAQAGDDSKGVRLLADIREIFKERATDRLPSAELTRALVEIETSPWGEWWQGKPLTAGRLARLLKPFEITPSTIRVGDSTHKGYLIAQFSDAFERYLPHPEQPIESASPPYPPSQKVTPSQPSVHAGASDFSEGNTKNRVTVQNPNNSNGMSDVTDVTFSNPPTGAGEALAPSSEGESVTTPKPAEVGKRWRF